MAVKIPYMVNESVGGGSLGQMNLLAPDFTGIAKAIGATGDMATEYFTKKQMERNDTIARKVQTDFTNQALQFEAELAQFKGEQAIGKTEEYKKKWEDYVKSYGESDDIAGNANHLKAVEFFGSKFGGDLNNTVAKYEIEQGKVHRGSVLVAQGETATAKIGAQSIGKGMPQIKAFLPEIDDIAKQLSAIDGKSVDYHRATLLTGVAKSYARQETNNELLLQTLNEMTGLIDEDVRSQLEGQVQGRLDAKQGQAYGTELFTSGVGQVDAVRAIMERYSNNDNARSSALSAYSQFKSAENAQRAEYDRQQNELLKTWLATGGDAPQGLSEDWAKRNTGMTLGDLYTKSQDDKPISAQTLLDAQNAFSLGVVAISKARTDEERQTAMNKTESVLLKINPKLAQQYAPKLAEYASKAGKPENLDTLPKVEAQVRTVFLQMTGKEYKPSKDGQSKQDRLYNRILATVMTNPSLQTTDGIKQTFLDQNRVVDEGFFSDTYKYQQESVSERQTKDAVSLGINFNARGSIGYRAFANAGMLGDKGVILPQYRMAVAQATKEYYERSLKKDGYGQNPTPEVIVEMLKKKGILKK